MEQALRSEGKGWRSVPDKLIARAARHPDRPAVIGPDGQLTYAELVARAAIFADRLGAPGGMVVGIRLRRDADMVAWLVAIMAAGAAYLPIDPGLPASRIAQMLDDARPGALIVGHGLADGLPETDLPTLTADVPVTRAQNAVLTPRCRPDDLAYLLYTSGSTGRPKGVEIPHRALSALLDAVAGIGLLRGGERLLAITRLGFDISVLELMLPLWVGGTVVVLPEGTVTDPRRLAEAVEGYRPDVVQATPATWRSLIDTGWRGAPGLRILCGGEAMSRDLADRLLPRADEVWNCYGPTETTVWSTVHRVDAARGPVPIGQPLAGTQVRILDPALSPVPAGMPGEIVISGPSLARGYRGAPALTATRFVTLDDGVRGYRTGDLGRLDPDGLLHCLGRLDDQVKIRGFRIELGDVEHALADHPDLFSAAARAWPDPAGETALVAYAVARRHRAIPVARVTDFLRERLPSYMVPSRVIFLDRMPLTPNGKIDRNLLPNPFKPIVGMAAPDSGSTADRLAAIWRELLGLDAVSPTDDFFELGGYSLITVRLLCRIEERFGRSLEIADLLRDSSLAGMARSIEQEPEGASMPIALNGAGSRPPLFWVDAGPLIRGMARAMPPDQPVHGLNLSRAEERGFADGPVDLARVADLLRTQLLRAQPHGPFHLGGWCRWAIVAHELACQLEAAGHEVALLILLDAQAPARGARNWLERVRHAIQPPRSPATQPGFGERIETASRRHRSARLKGDCLLIRPADGKGGDRTQGWRAHAGDRLQVDEVMGTHETMIRPPHVARLAAVVGRRLAECQESTGETVAVAQTFSPAPERVRQVAPA